MINKNWAFALGILSLSTAMVAADQGSAQMDKNPPVPMGVTSQPTGVITPPVAPAVNHGADVFLTADFIYWKAHQDGLEYAESGITTTPLVLNPSLTRGTVASASSRWEPGFKVGLGLEFEHDGWDLFAQYTWLDPQSHHDSTYDPAGPSGLFPLLGATTTNAGISTAAAALTDATATWKMNYNVVDLELGRNFFVSRYMTLRPHFGLKSAWINQRFNVDQDFASTQFVAFISEAINHKQSSWGIGIRAGLDPVWHFARSWGLYGNFAFSALYSYFKDKVTDTLYTGVGQTGIASVYETTQRSFHDVTPILELGLGLTYMDWFYDEAYMLEVRAGWEEQVWFQTNQFVSSLNPRTGNLTTQGFTLKVGFHF